MRLQAKVAVVTGGGRGIGAGITHKLHAAGAQVLIAQRQPPAQALLAQPGIAFVAVDLAEPDAPASIAQAALDHFGGADILVNNAGIMFECELERMQMAQWDQMMAVNLRAPLFVAQALIGQMRARGGGSIINIGSIEGLAANPAHTAYCASKSGLHGMTQAMAVDLGSADIRCNAIAPGWIESDLSEAYLHSQSDPAQARTALDALHPLGRTGQPGDVGDAVVFLASDESAFVTGQVITVDGGRTARLPLPF